MNSFRLIGTYSTNSQNLSAWGGPASSVAWSAPGTVASGTSNFEVSAFDVGSTFGSGYTDVLNDLSIYGSDELNLSALLAHTSNYSVSNATVFNWNGNPSTPGFGCDTFSMSISGGMLNYNDALTTANWGEIRDYEASINGSSYPNGVQGSISGFQDTNLKITGSGCMFQVENVQSGTFDFSSATRGVVFQITTASDSTQGSTQTYAVIGEAASTSIQVVNGSTTQDYNGTALTDDGSTSLMDYYGEGGADMINLTSSRISSNLYLGAGTSQTTSAGGSMNFIPSGTQFGFEEETNSAGGDVIRLDTAGSGAAHIYTKLTAGFQDIESFEFGRDVVDIATGGSSTTSSISVSSTNDSAWVHGTAGSAVTHGVVFNGVSATTIAAHESSVTISGVSYLQIS